MKKNQTNNSTNWKNEVNEIRGRLEAVKTRSCWDRGVKGFALDLLESYENICEYCEHNGQPIPELNEETLLNGAADWRAYCYGGCGADSIQGISPRMTADITIISN